MNIPNFREFVERFRDKADPDRFNMAFWFAADMTWKDEHGRERTILDETDLIRFEENKCNTTACLGGWIQYLMDLPGKYAFEAATDFLELDEEEANHLFYGRWHSEDSGKNLRATYEDALEYLTEAAEKGKIIL